jgi:mannonate dehydratase
MRELWRWFGPLDSVSLDDIRQAGAQGVVTALHYVPAGVEWTEKQIAHRQQEIARNSDGTDTGLAWEVVESLPVSEDIKTQSGAWRDHIAAYTRSMTALSHRGITNICYNFMPVLDWTRTDLRAKMPHGGTAMRFDIVDFAVFDLHILQRQGAENTYGEAARDAAAQRFSAMEDTQTRQLARNVVAGLPGAVDSWTRKAGRLCKPRCDAPASEPD